MNDNTISDLVFKQLTSEQENKHCIDCNTASPQWANVSTGTFICMNCAGVHRGFGVHISQVRSLTMDSWTERQLKFMSIGGNERCRIYMEGFDLVDEPVTQRYKTEALAFYRKQLNSEADGQGFFEERPNYEIGRQTIVEQTRSAEEIMQNNPAFGSGPGAQVQSQVNEVGNQAYDSAKDMLTSLSGMLWTGYETTKTKSTELASRASEATSQKLEGTVIQTGYSNYVSPALTTAQPYASLALQKTKDGAVYAGSSIKNTGNEIYEHGGQAPTLQKATSTVSSGASAVSSGAYNAFGWMTEKASYMKESMQSIVEQANEINKNKQAQQEAADFMPPEQTQQQTPMDLLMGGDQPKIPVKSEEQKHNNMD